MKHKAVLAALLVIGVALLAACKVVEVPTPTPTPPLSVTIGPTEPEEFVAAGQRIALVAHSTPVDVVFNWQLTGSGQLSNTEGASVQYLAPTSVTVEETVSIVVTITDKTTQAQTSDGTIIRLLPAAAAEVVATTPAASSGASTGTAESPGDTPQANAGDRTATPRPVATEKPTTPQPAAPAADAPCPAFTSKRYGDPLLAGSQMEGQILSPTECQIGLPAASELEISGTLGAIPADTFVWLFAFTKSGRYYPQCAGYDPSSCVLSGDNWTTRTYLGNAGCKENFILTLLAVDGEGDQVLKETWGNWTTTGSYPGFTGSAINGMNAEEISRVHVETAGVECP